MKYFDATMTSETDALLRRCIDRNAETELCLSGILSHEKIIMIGERGVGKTFIIKNLQNQISKQYPFLLPIYFSFSPTIYFNSNSHLHNVYFLLFSLIQYIWEKILGNKMSLLFSSEYNEKLFNNNLEQQVIRVYRLAHIINRNIDSLRKYQLSAKFIVEGGLEKEQNVSEDYSPISSQEVITLFSELCEDLKKHRNVDSLVFLCDEANHLRIDLQNDIEKELFNILPSLSCSFVYVRSVLSETTSYSTNVCFEREITVNGFKNVENTKELISSRVIDPDLLLVEDDSIAIIHDATGGCPRYIIELMHMIIQNKLINSINEIITVSPVDAALSANSFLKRLMYQELEKQKYMKR